MDFSSDTSAPVHPAVFEALQAANTGMAPSYGNDPYTLQLQELVCSLFETQDVAILPVASGTAANALALSVLCGPVESILCHEASHIACDERGAPEFYTGGGKLILLKGEHGKITPPVLKSACQKINRSFVHETPASALSLTNLTESGTAYSPDEITELAGIARSAGLRVHLDGVRLSNALVSTEATPADMSWRAGVDVLTLGLTKTGAAGCELICLFGKTRTRYGELLARAKRGGHLPPKMRYLSAQGIAMLTDGLWLKLASAANMAASRLADRLVSEFGATLASPVQGNEVFAYLEQATHERLLGSGLKAYAWMDGSVRFVCNWTMSPNDIDRCFI